MLISMKIETMNIFLPTPLKAYVQQRVKRDGYGNISEYMRELIRDDQKKKAKERLDSLLLEGLEGKDFPIDDAYWKSLRQHVKDRHTSNTNRRSSART